MPGKNSGDGAEDDPDEPAGAKCAGEQHQIIQPRAPQLQQVAQDGGVEVHARTPGAGSAVAAGAIFTIYSAATSQEFPTNTNRSPRLLIVDDSPVALAFLEAVFRGAHYEVETASNGVDGLDKALRSTPDLIVTDGVMPDVDGFELVRRLRSHPETARVPVVMLTSVDTLDPEYSERLPQPDAMVAKSMQIEPLMNQVKTLLRKATLGR